MKRVIANVPTYKVELSELEYNAIQNCLDYAYHRLARHLHCGITGIVIKSYVDKLRGEWRVG